LLRGTTLIRSRQIATKSFIVPSRRITAETNRQPASSLQLQGEFSAFRTGSQRPPALCNGRERLLLLFIAFQL